MIPQRGKRNTSVAPLAQLTLTQCPKCGNEQFSEDAEFCRICGASLYNYCEGEDIFDYNGNFDHTETHMLEYYRLEKDFEGSIGLESTQEGFRPITGESGRREKKKDPLAVLIEMINEKYGTDFTEMDKVLLQIENDYASEEKWQSYAENNDRKTFMLLFEKDFPEMAATRYEKNDDFFVRMFSDPDMMKQVMGSIGSVLYEKLKRKSYGTNSKPKLSKVAEGSVQYRNDRVE